MLLCLWVVLGLTGRGWRDLLSLGYMPIVGAWRTTEGRLYIGCSVSRSLMPSRVRYACVAQFRWKAAGTRAAQARAMPDMPVWPGLSGHSARPGQHSLENESNECRLVRGASPFPLP